MSFSPVVNVRPLLLLCWLLALAPALAEEWVIQRFEGRDYVTLDNIAAFYGLPAPPLINPADAVATATAPPVQTAPVTPPASAPATPAPTVAMAPTVPAPAPLVSAASTPAPLASTVAAAPAPTTPTSTGAAPAAPTVSSSVLPGLPPIASAEGEAATTLPPFQPTGGKVITLDNGRSQLAVTINSREAQINGVKQWLAFPAHYHEGRLYISRLDLAKIIEPRLRPERIPGLRPVTTIVLDPGHGGGDKGAASRYGFEKAFALDVALRARDLLERMGLKVVMTRSADIFIPLHQRPAVANRIPDSVFVSIHFNATSSNPDARGFEIYSLAPRGAPATNDALSTVRDLRDEPGNIVDTQSTVLAGTVFHSLLGNVPMQDRGLKHARFAVLRLCTQPAVLVECGFVSNSAESALIGSPAWRQKVAEAIVTGIQSYKELAEQRQTPRVLAQYRQGK